jgi:hypothetical protein
MLAGLVMHRSAERAKCGSSWNVRGVETLGNVGGDPNAHGSSVAFDDERVAIKPKPVGQARDQRRDRGKDASAGDVGAYVRGERATVENDGDRGPRWE